MEILLFLGLVSMIWAAGFYLGWSHREDKFQDGSVTFVIGVENTVNVDNRGGKTKITIYNEKLVEIIRP
jgi:hypothetical protein